VSNIRTKKKLVLWILIAVLFVGVFGYYLKVNAHKLALQNNLLPAPVEVMAINVGKKDVPMIKEWVGTTDGYVNAQIHAQVSGYLLKRDYEEGTTVKKDQIMFEIDPRQYQASLDNAKSDLTKAIAAQKKSQDDVRRYKQLVGQGAVSKKELDDASRSNDMNKASINSAKAALEQAQNNLSWTKVTAPITGLAGASIAQIGDLIDPSTTLTTVSVIDPMKVIFPISENEYIWYQKMRADNNANKAKDMDVTIILNDGSTYPEKGTFSFADREVDPKTGTIMVQVTAPNSKGILRPGQYAKVRANVGSFKDAIVIPRRAIIETQGTTQIAVVGPGNKIEMRNISLGYTSNNERIVTAGLKEGESIVVDGFLKIRDGSIVSVKKDTTDNTINN